MTELILSDITRMGQGYCVIGLETGPQGNVRSVRPRPPYTFAWREPFQFKRGDSVRCRLRPPAYVRLPHKEDMDSFGLRTTSRKISHEDLVGILEKAERASAPDEFFGCSLQRDHPRGNYWITESDGKRSICGSDFDNIYFEVYSDERWSLRARMLVGAALRFDSLPIVDKEWCQYLDNLVGLLKGAQTAERAKLHFNRVVRPKLMDSRLKFVRIGLARANQGKCWLMLDSLFPQPEESWLAQLAPTRI